MRGFVLGGLVFLGSIWATAYGLHVLPDGHWSLLPVLVTGMIGMVVGIAIFVIWGEPK